MSKAEIFFDAGSLQALETAFAPLEKLSGTNQRVFVRAFDDTTEEFVNGKFQVPGDVTSGTVTLRAFIMPKTGAASKNVQLRFKHLARENNEAYDTAGTNKDSGDKAITATTGNITVITWTETVANLGWVANDLVLFSLSRIAPSADNLSGDMYLQGFTIEIPLA
jgi:hypothetical protein